MQIWGNKKNFAYNIWPREFLGEVYFSPNPFWAAPAVAIQTSPIKILFLFLKIWEIFLDVNAHPEDPGLCSKFRRNRSNRLGGVQPRTDRQTDGRRTVFPQTSIQLQHAHTQARETNETPISDTKPPPFGRWFDKITF